MKCKCSGFSDLLTLRAPLWRHALSVFGSVPMVCISRSLRTSFCLAANSLSLKLMLKPRAPLWKARGFCNLLILSALSARVGSVGKRAARLADTRASRSNQAEQQEPRAAPPDLCRRRGGGPGTAWGICLIFDKNQTNFRARIRPSVVCRPVSRLYPHTFSLRG